MILFMINLCVVDFFVCFFGYIVVVNYNIVDFVNIGEVFVFCFWLVFINIVIGLVLIGILIVMVMIIYIGILRNEIV